MPANPPKSCDDPVLVGPVLVDAGLVDPTLVDPALVGPVLVDAALVDPAPYGLSLANRESPARTPATGSCGRVACRGVTNAAAADIAGTIGA